MFGSGMCQRVWVGRGSALSSPRPPTDGGQPNSALLSKGPRALDPGGQGRWSGVEMGEQGCGEQLPYRQGNPQHVLARLKDAISGLASCLPRRAAGRSHEDYGSRKVLPVAASCPPSPHPLPHRLVAACCKLVSVGARELF